MSESYEERSRKAYEQMGFAHARKTDAYSPNSFGRSLLEQSVVKKAGRVWQSNRTLTKEELEEEIKKSERQDRSF